MTTITTDDHREDEDARIEDVQRALSSLSRRARIVLTAQRLGVMIAAATAGVIVLSVVDYALRLPASLRMLHWLAGGGIIIWAIVTFILPALRMNPSGSTLALRIERHHPELAGLLASGVELGASSDAQRRMTPVELALAQRVVRDAASRFRGDAVRDLVRADRLTHAIASLLVVFLGVGAIALVSPHLSAIGAQRTLAPWTDAHWPKRTAVADATDIEVHPLGAAIPLQAVLTRSNRAPERTDVSVEHRAIRDGAPGSIRRELMTWQDRAAAAPTGEEGALFERLIEADAAAVEYRFVTADDRTPWRRITLTPTPAVLGATARVTPPTYAESLSPADPAGPIVRETSVDLGDGTDERAIAPPALFGSEIDLLVRLNKPIELRGDDPQWLAAVFGADARRAGVAIQREPVNATVWRLSWTLEDSIRMPIALRDEHGIESSNEPVFRFEAVRDRPANATVTEPSSDRNLLATAVVRIVAEGRDDVGLEDVWIDRQRHRPAGAPGSEPSGPGGAVEPVEEPVTVIREAAPGRRAHQIETTLDLAPLGVRPGDEVWITAVASDVFSLNGVRHDPTRSAPRRLRIISESEFIEEIRSELSSVRQGAIRLHDEQLALRDRPDHRRVDEQSQREQGQLTERIARLGEQLQRIDQRVRDNALNDRQLENVLDDASRFVDEAGRWSTRASDRMDDAAQRAEDEERIDPERERQLDDAQRRVQNELGGLAELLDTGEDAWVMRRQLEQLLRDQQELREQTGQLGRETAGRSLDELTPEERSELERIVDRQRELAQQAEELIDELDQRSRELEENDPTTAAGMRQASRRARQTQVPETMEDAADQAEQNRAATAGERQQQAADDLEEMLRDLDEAERSREEVLRRMLASLIESLEALIQAQRNELDALAAARDVNRFDGLDLGMIRLNRNTLGVLDQAGAAGRELAPVADLIGRAVEAQTRAIIALRADPVEAIVAEEHERASLDLLEQARDRAEEIDRQLQQREQARARQELRRAYLDALEQQVAMRAETEDFAALDELDRRQRAGLRRLSMQQLDLQSTLNELRERTDGLSDKAVFDYAHRRLDALTGRAASALSDTAPVDALPVQDTAIAILQGLVDSLEETGPGQDDEFGQGAGGGGGGGQDGESELIPPLAELRLLRQIQAELARRTRLAGDRGVADPAEIEGLGDEQQELSELGEDLVRRMTEQQQPPSLPGG